MASAQIPVTKHNSVANSTDELDSNQFFSCHFLFQFKLTNFFKTANGDSLLKDSHGNGHYTNPGQWSFFFATKDQVQFCFFDPTSSLICTGIFFWTGIRAMHETRNGGFPQPVKWSAAGELRHFESDGTRRRAEGRNGNAKRVASYFIFPFILSLWSTSSPQCTSVADRRVMSN